MARRGSKIEDDKAKKDAKAQEPEAETTETATPEDDAPAPSEAAAAAMADDDGMEDDDLDGLEDDLDDAEAAVEAASPSGPDTPERTGPRLQTPNRPSFDWTKKGRSCKPNLMKGEEVASEGKTDGGLKFVRTTQGRHIFLCTVEEYQAERGPVPLPNLYRKAFPHAFEDQGKK